MCISTTKAPDAAATSRLRGSWVRPLTSLMIAAPAATAAAITAALRVSMETVTPCRANASTTGSTRRSSSPSGTSTAPGRVELAADVDDVRTLLRQPQPVLDRALRVGMRPPSLKLSGVTLRMPISRGRSNGAARADGEGERPVEIGRVEPGAAAGSAGLPLDHLRPASRRACRRATVRPAPPPPARSPTWQTAGCR